MHNTTPTFNRFILMSPPALLSRDNRRSCLSWCAIRGSWACALLVLLVSQPAAGQALGPAAPRPVVGIDSGLHQFSPATRWHDGGPIHWQGYAQGEYVGPARLPHVPQYRMRVDDELEFIYRVTRDRTSRPYELNVGDEIEVESFADAKIRRRVIILPDGTVSLALLGQVSAAGKTIEQLREDLNRRYQKFYKHPSITVIPLQVNTKLEDLRATVDSRAGAGGQNISARVTPDGTVSLPAIGSVPAQGLTLSELKREIDARYDEEVEGIEVTPVLAQRAPRFIFVVGEVTNPGRYVMEGPTTVMQSIALAGSWNVGANLHQVVVFRRGDDWRLLATILDVKKALYAKRPIPADELWLSDSDIVVVPKSKILQFNEWVDLVFTQGIYGLLPGQANSVIFVGQGRL
ncbi:MAG: polysaccharide biosynthesis/export family protein [Planctomycetota bacterium]|nr:polysaccharide biosynthesis/export family protein [Planctomycetota bacterium]